MNILLIFTFFIISGAVRCIDVIGYSGGSVLVDSQRRWHNDYKQYLHKKPPDELKMLINSEKHNAWINKGRFSLLCNESRALMVYIKDLNTQDSGTYRIGVDGKWSLDMSLNVKDDSCCGASQRVMVNTGQTANLACQYSQDYKTEDKIIFKERKDSIEMIYNTWNQKERFSISDDRDNNLFSVRITDVRSEDAGVYLCGVWLNKISYSYSILTAVHLHIMNPVLSHWWVNKSVSVGDEVNITCQIPEEHNFSPKLFCKEDENHICQTVSRSEVKLNDFSDKSVFTVIISDVTVRDAGVYWCGAETSHTDFTFISLTTKVQLKLSMFGDEGGSAQIMCPYDPIYKSTSIKLLKSCTDKNTLMEMNRWSVNDDMTASVFSVNITGLTAEDAGKYCCAMTLETDVIYLYTHLFIIIKQDERHFH
ncbi:Polymeric immunoglobulin receptor [Triplophysa tibetana]|nr:Polymeric immunoglobulin receptor [Triplophysa tibetana]